MESCLEQTDMAEVCSAVRTSKAKSPPSSSFIFSCAEAEKHVLQGCTQYKEGEGIHCP